jgi:NhaP-type Na+/H+ or K+/H+ antiporter
MEQATIIIALIGVLGIGAQWIAWRTGWPAIVLMLAAGFVAGPLTGLIDPKETFGSLLEPMVSIGVALILFEGGLSLDLRELRHAGDGVKRLVFVGVPVGWFLGAMACYFIAGLVWPIAILFAGILVVTGPTVVLPLLRQSRIAQRPAAILKWEAIVNDPFGALCAVIAYEYFRRAADGATMIEVVPPMLMAATLASAMGFAVAWAIAWCFPRGFVPEFLKVPVLLVAVIGAFVLANQIEHEAGLLTVTVMGIALANMNVASLRSIHPFKQHVALLLVSGIFILLSASLDLTAFRQFEWRFGMFLLALIFVVRPATVLISLLRSSVPWNERLFLAWIAPRGIVLVAVAGLFALRLQELGYENATLLISLSFAVVVVTIVAHGFTIGLAARLLGIRQDDPPGLLIVGSSEWSVALGKLLQGLGRPVLVADMSWQRLALARREGLSVYHGEILNEATEHTLDLTPYRVLVAVTDNEAYNTLVCSEFAPEIGTDSVYQLGAVPDGDWRALPASLRGRSLFANGLGVEDLRQRQKEGWVFRKTRLSEQFNFEDAQDTLPPAAEMLLILRPGGQLRFFTHAAAPKPTAGDIVISYSPPKGGGFEQDTVKRQAVEEGTQ